MIHGRCSHFIANPAMLQGKREVAQHDGWNRQTQLGDGSIATSETIAKGFSDFVALWLCVR
jgi:hypothetical protein